MRLISFKNGSRNQIGALYKDEVIPFSLDSSLPEDMLSFLEAGEDALKAARKLFETTHKRIAVNDIKILAPISRPPKIIAIGLNYADHLEEIKASGREMEAPKVPMIFNKQSLSVVGPYDDIHDPKVSEMLDYEGVGL